MAVVLLSTFVGVALLPLANVARQPVLLRSRASLPGQLGSTAQRSRELPTVTVPRSPPLSRCAVAMVAEAKEIRQATRLPQLRVSRERLTIGLLSFLSGWADIVCFKQYRCYLIMMTGNTISLASAMARLCWGDIAFYLCIVLNYVLGAAFFRWVDVKLHLRKAVYAAAACVLAVFGLADLLAYLQPTHRGPVLLLSFGFGAINSVSTERTGVISCMMTGHLQKLGNNLVELCSDGLSAAQMDALATSATVLLSFIAGIMCIGMISKVISWPFSFAPTFSILAGAYACVFALQGEREVSHQLPAIPPTESGPEMVGEEEVGVGCELDPYFTECR